MMRDFCSSCAVFVANHYLQQIAEELYSALLKPVNTHTPFVDDWQLRLSHDIMLPLPQRL